MTTSIPLSIIDQTPVVSGHSVADAIAATLDLAQAADDLGYHRYWCAEHHGLRSVANPCPEVVLARLGGLTRRIRLGSGGVMLPYYSPFKVAEQFLMLEALFPGRIDLAVGRAPGGDMAAARAVGYGRFDSDMFPQQVADLAALYAGRLPEGHYARDVLMQPDVPGRPELWVLGSSEFGGALAAELGLYHAFAHFINPHGTDAIGRAYRANFRPGYVDRPRCAVAVFVICAESDREAEDLARAVDLRRLQMALGLNVPIPTVDEARTRTYGPREIQLMESQRPRSVIGTPERVVERMHAVRVAFEADEIMVLTVAPSYAVRLRSYELLAGAFGLTGRSPAPAAQ